MEIKFNALSISNGTNKNMNDSNKSFFNLFCLFD
jgi:hypothetical protein